MIAFLLRNNSTNLRFLVLTMNLLSQRATPTEGLTAGTLSSSMISSTADGLFAKPF